MSEAGNLPPTPNGRACAGAADVEVRTGAWAALGGDAAPIRRRVFIEEHGIAAALDVDAADATALHAVAYDRLGAPVATGRLTLQAPGVARLGRLAVLAPLRGRGIGRAVLDALTAAARARGDRELMLHAQASAAPFYRRAGFIERGDAFVEAAVPHVEMVRALR
jgi:predicted GNAT family N-acyltransferase